MKPFRTRSLSALLGVLALCILSGCEKKTADAPPVDATAAAVAATNQPVPGFTDNLAFAKLQGKWLRPDGGYILDIRHVAPDGILEAAYFNPRPIHVAKAVGFQEGGTVKAFVELRDVNYPGSTYTLIYDPTNDQLKGDYFQAALKQTFDVFFTRQP